MKNILIACEESQAVCIEFRKKNQRAYSCDTKPCTGGHPEWHLQEDVTRLLKYKWNAIIAFPPCTYLSVTGNRWLNVEQYGEKAIKRHKDRELAIKFFMRFTNANSNHIAIENPVGIMNTSWRKPDQIINPYLFGDPFEKRTCLWLKNLPVLEPTKVVKPPPRKKYKSGKTMAAWYANAPSLHKHERSKLRSKTFPGIAAAMANQWSAVIS